MERLTIRTPKGAALKMADQYDSEAEARADLMQRYLVAVDRLADYEDTGLTPEEINGLCAMDRRAKMANLLRLEEYQELGSVDHIRELVRAENEGRLVNYLPGDTVYDRFGMAWTVKTSEIHKFDDGMLRYLYRCGHTGTDDYRALYSDEILTREEAEAAKAALDGSQT